jgi:hypothetical protein
MKLFGLEIDHEQEKIELSWGIVDKIKGEDEKTKHL